MQTIDPYSYQCGAIDCFNEMVRAGVKRLALSHPVDTAALTAPSSIPKTLL